MYGGWIYNFLCNRCLSPLTWVRIPPRRVTYKVCQWLAVAQWFSLCTLVSSTSKTDRLHITEILLKVALTPKNVGEIYISLFIKKIMKLFLLRKYDTNHFMFIYIFNLIHLCNIKNKYSMFSTGLPEENPDIQSSWRPWNVCQGR